MNSLNRKIDEQVSDAIVNLTDSQNTNPNPNPNHEDNLMTNPITPVNTLDKFGFCELVGLNALIRAYANAGAHNDGKIFAELPATWNDAGVCPDFSADHGGLVFLVNQEHQALINTKYGVMAWYTTPYAGHEGTLFDLAEQVNADLSDDEGYTIPAGAGAWHRDDLSAVYAYLDEDIEALRDTDADMEDLYRVKHRIALAFVKASLADAPLGQAELDTYSDNELTNHCLADLGREIADDSDFYKYVDFIRDTAKAMLGTK